MMRLSTTDREEAIAAVSRVYCAHELQLDPRSRTGTTTLQADGDGTVAHVGLGYGAAAEVDAGDLTGITLIMHAVSGAGSVHQGRRRGDWSGTQTLAVAGNRATRFSFGAMFSQSTIRLDPVRIRRTCEELTGTGLGSDVTFDLVPFGPDVEPLWAHVLALATRQAHLPATALAHLERFATELLLHHCPHNYSHLFNPADRVPAGLTGRACELIDSLPDHELLLTVGELAARLGVSARSLERSFREHLGVSPTQHLRNRRLDRARVQLELAAPDVTVTDVAVSLGFFHTGRFAGYYRARFGEDPSKTLQLR